MIVSSFVHQMDTSCFKTAWLGRLRCVGVTYSASDLSIFTLYYRPVIDLFPATRDRRALLDVQRVVTAHARVEDRFDEIKTIEVLIRHFLTIRWYQES